jgi:glycosyltransferase involved in cell wall biosynthesis
LKVVLATMQLGGSYRHGTEHYVGSLLKSLPTLGHTAVCLAGDPRGERGALPLGTAIAADAAILHYPTRGWAAVDGLAPAALEPLLRDLDPDVIHLASPAHIGVGVAIACRNLGIPLVVTMMDYWWICPRGTLLRDGREPCDAVPSGRACLRCVLGAHPAHSLRGVARRTSPALPLDLLFLLAGVARHGGSLGEVPHWLRRREPLVALLADAARVIFPSPATRDRILPFLRHERWEEIPYGLEPHWFGEPHLPRRGTDPSALTIGFAGSLQPHKGADLLLAAIRHLGWTRTRVRIAGTADDPAYFERLQQLAAGLRVEFTGALEAAEMRSFLSGLDLAVIASRWPENLPYALLEAQAGGVPVIASNVAGMSHRIPDSRMLFQPGSPEDLARALAEFQSSPSTVPAPPVSTLEDMARATEAAYCTALGHRPPPASRP